VASWPCWDAHGGHGDGQDGVGCWRSATVAGPNLFKFSNCSSPNLFKFDIYSNFKISILKVVQFQKVIKFIKCSDLELFKFL
jgi:hypothetical protein